MRKSKFQLSHSTGGKKKGGAAQWETLHATMIGMKNLIP